MGLELQKKEKCGKHITNTKTGPGDWGYDSLSSRLLIRGGAGIC